MLTTLLTIQTVCIATSAYITYRNTSKRIKLKLDHKSKGFKHYRTGGF
jgi:hypothetical protein